MRILAAVLLVVLVGCGRHKSASPSAPSRVSQFQTTPLPVPPPIPDPAPVADDVAGAKAELQAGQANVQQVLQVAQSNPAGAPVVPTLASAAQHFAAALTKLDQAGAHITELTQKLQASETAHANAEGILKNDIERLKAAAGSDAATATKEVTALEKENEELKDESIRQAKTRLLWLGIAMLLGMGGCIAGASYGFAPGWKLAGFFGIAGVALIGLSQLLTKIAFVGECVCIGTAALLVVWLVWEAFHHKPIVVPGGKTNAA